MTQRYDVIVVGMGVGGEEVAGRTAEAGLRVLAVERKLVGGECPYWGCVPSKMMIRAANSLAEAARVIGLAGEAKIAPEWAPVAKRIRVQATDNWNDGVAIERHRSKGSTVVKGDARFIAPDEVEVTGERYSASRGIVVATGTDPAAPPVEGLDEVSYWTNRDAIEAEELPGSLIVLGGGSIGLELAQVFNRFGTKVTVVELMSHILSVEEPEHGEAMAEVLRTEGIDVFTNAEATKVRADPGQITVELSGGQTLTAERLLVATGRRADLASLGIGAAGLDEGAASIPVDEHMRAADGIWAVGDVTDHGGFTHLAVYQGRIAAADILGHDHAAADYSAIPRVTFTDPEVGAVGLTEEQARERGLNLRVGTAQTASSARGWIHGPGAEHGVIKLVADGEAGVLVGASSMGPAAGEVLGLMVLAVKERVPVRALSELIYPYPTFVRGIEDALRDLS
jgi:pyruvate/2-oxoglutarate dehydrogenase complex dihydrolipoamide dehydrogenase (E3) component